MNDDKKKNKEEDLKVIIEIEPTLQAEQDRIGRRILEILINKIDEKDKKK